MSRSAPALRATHDVRLRPALAGDHDALNAVIERAVMTWQLAERVKHFSSRRGSERCRQHEASGHGIESVQHLMETAA